VICRFQFTLPGCTVDGLEVRRSPPRDVNRCKCAQGPDNLTHQAREYPAKSLQFDTKEPLYAALFSEQPGAEIQQKNWWFQNLPIENMFVKHGHVFQTRGEM